MTLIHPRSGLYKNVNGAHKTMNSSEIITVYEAILATTGQMLKAVRSADWENLIVLERECGKLAKILVINDKSKMILSGKLRQRKLEIIRQILEDDVEIRTLTQPWMAQLHNILSNTVYKRRLPQTPYSIITAT